MAVLNSINNTSQVVPVNGFLNFLTNTVNLGCGIEHLAGSNTVGLKGCGVYLVSVNADITPTAAGLITMRLLRNGVAVAGAEGSVTGVAATVANVGFTTLVRVMKSCPNVIDNNANLQVQLTADATVTNSSITVVKVV